MLYILMIYFIIINLAGFYIMKADKTKARKNEYRISEKTLWLVALFLGATGMTFGMKAFRHKTKHLQFKLGLPVLALIEIALCLYLLILLS
ncbi:DUF1294 domain-containing protein [Cytobacillus massiliigabonensis]|uniref:DUF1294 domain-containing protein n=1 Tax=Cytobacillus massiliigabonensis TaxID=1871011 RepID=UPI000C8579F2|nr:DUF1294 domain-containing protein [Cytobacillus massiliigabonensis]